MSELGVDFHFHYHPPSHVETNSASGRVARAPTSAKTARGWWKTPVEDVLPLCHHVLLMSVNPGFGGQSFIPSAAERVAELERDKAFLAHLERVQQDLDRYLHISVSEILKTVDELRTTM